MGIWSHHDSASHSLRGSQGELISIAVCVEPHRLEGVLDALAGASFPINPEIFHKAALRYQYGNGREELEPTTLVAFPAYAGQLGEVEAILERCELPRRYLFVKTLLEDLHGEAERYPGSAGAPYAAVMLERHMPAV